MKILKQIYLLLDPKEKFQFIYLHFLIIISMIFEMLGIGIIIPAINLLLEPEVFFKKINLSFTSYEFTSNQIIYIGILTLIFIYFIKSIYLIFFYWKQTIFAKIVQTNTANKLFKVYLNKKWLFHTNTNSSDLISNILNETTLFVTLVQSVIMLITELFIIIGICLVLFFFQPVALLILSIFLSMLVFIYYTIVKRKIATWGEKRQKVEKNRIKNIQEGLGGIKEVLIFSRQQFFENNFYKNNNKTNYYYQLSAFVNLIPKIWLEFFAVLSLAIITLILVQKNSGDNLIPILGMFGFAVFRFIPSSNRIINCIQNIKYSLPSINKITYELQDSIEENKKESNIDIKFNKNIEFNNVSYFYNKKKYFNLKDISFSINKGQSVGIMGQSGSGKSTLIDILMGLFEPQSGSIDVDGINIQKNLHKWKNIIGYVPQKIFLLDDSIKNNIAFGLSNIDNELLNKAIKDAELDNLIKSLPEGIDTIVGERGARLSGGQIQRIGIARALYNNPSILILDEATSSLDKDTERKIMYSINALQRKKTLIIVSHRISTLSNCDFIIEIEKGEIINQK